MLSSLNLKRSATALVLKKITDLRLNLKARDWCRLPYPDHAHGCPNFNHKPTCPSQVPLLFDYFDLSQPLYLLAIQFNLAAHVARMLKSNPGWSDRQARCVLYWQGHVNKELAETASTVCASLVQSGRKCIYTTCPEAMGVNVIATALRCGVPIKVKPTDTVYKIAFIGYDHG